MALANVKKFPFPRLFFTEATNNNIVASAGASLSLTTAARAIAWVGQAESDITITTVNFYLNTVTTGCTMNVRIETLNTSQRPSGTLYAVDSSGTVVIDNADDNTWKTATLTTPVVIARGAFFAIVFNIASGTPNLNMAAYSTSFVAFPKMPLTLSSTDSGATWAGTPQGILCCFLNSGADTQEIDGLTAHYGGLTGNTINADSAPDEYAMRITVPFACRVIGGKIMVNDAAAQADHSVFLYDSDSNVLGTVTVDAQIYYATGDDGYRSYYFENVVELEAGDTVYLAVRADRNGSFTQFVVPTILVNSTGHNATSYGDICALATRTWATAGPPASPGAWTIDANAQLLAALIIDQLDDGISPPSYFTDNEPVPFPDIQMQPQILYHNIFSFPGAFVDDATGWTNSGNGDIERLIDPYANVVWEADDNTASGTISFPHVVSANSIGIARHMLDGHTVTIEYSDDNGDTWHVAGVFAPTAGRVLFQALDGVFTADLWRFTVEGDTPAQVSHMSVGVVTAFERRMYAGVVPSLVNRDAKMSVGGGSGGQHVGDRFLRERVRQTFDVKHLTGEWVRVQGKPLMEFARSSSVFAAWRPGKYPLDVVYGWSDGDVKASHSGPASYMDFDITIEGIDTWQN